MYIKKQYIVLIQDFWEAKVVTVFKGEGKRKLRRDVKQYYLRFLKTLFARRVLFYIPLSYILLHPVLLHYLTAFTDCWNIGSAATATDRG